MFSLDIQTHESELNQTQFQLMPDNQLIHIQFIPQGYTIVGIGTDAVILQHPSESNYVFKIFSPHNLHPMHNEYLAYQKIGTSPYFSKCYYKGARFLVLRFEEGPTLYKCLLEGIFIPEQIIDDVESACVHAREAGLNPRDIHLKNIILQNDRAKLIDISEYVQPGSDLRWMHLVEAYRQFYPLIRGKKIPHHLIETVKKFYSTQVKDDLWVKKSRNKLMSILDYYRI